ncbi:MAG: hypothetical protein AAF677_12585 [Pseudomonadota bacterium]
MVIYQRQGILTLLIAFLSFGIVYLLDIDYGGYDQDLAEGASAFALAAGLNYAFWIGLKINGMGEAQTLFFIPIRFWSLLYLAASGVALAGVLT